MNQRIIYLVFTFVLTIEIQYTKAQSIETYMGLHLNRFFDTSNDGAPYNRSIYSSTPNLAFGIGFTDTDFTKNPVDFFINFERYGGDVSGRSGGLGGGLSVSATTSKSILSLSILPMKFQLGSHFEINFGMNIGMLLIEDVEGTRTTSAGNSPTSQDLQNDQVSFNSKVNLGVIGQLKYQIQVSEKTSVLPFYQYYLGFLNEFRDFPKNTKSMRHYLGIMVRNQL